MVDPSVECIIATPVCPHSLNSRPVIFSSMSELTIRNDTDRDIPMFVTLDGGDNLKIEYSEAVSVKRSDITTKLVRIKDECFYRTLSKKMN